MLNKDLRTIEYDDIQNNTLKINKWMLPKNIIDTHHFVNFLIDCCKVFYKESCNKSTWVRFNVDKQFNPLVSYHASINKSGLTIFYAYYSLKTFRSYLRTMIKGINYIYSDECKRKDILNHPNYHKGHKYFLTAIDANMTMINELLMMNSIYIKSSKKVNTNSSCHLNITTNTVKVIKHVYDANLTFDTDQFSDITNNQDELKKLFKENNNKLHVYILDFLKPSNFMDLYMSLWHYRLAFYKNVYFYNLINNIPNPDYIGNNIHVTIDIE
jgi:ribosomal protein S8